MRGGRNKFGPMYKRDRARKLQIMRQRQLAVQHGRHSGLPLDGISYSPNHSAYVTQGGVTIKQEIQIPQVRSRQMSGSNVGAAGGEFDDFYLLASTGVISNVIPRLLSFTYPGLPNNGQRRDAGDPFGSKDLGNFLHLTKFSLNESFRIWSEYEHYCQSQFSGKKQQTAPPRSLRSRNPARIWKLAELGLGRRSPF